LEVANLKTRKEDRRGSNNATIIHISQLRPNNAHLQNITMTLALRPVFSAAARQLSTRSPAHALIRPARTASRRSISSAPSVSDPKITSKLPQGNDSLWAISSVVVFGSLFFYLTSPGKSGSGHGHGSHDDHKHDGASSSSAASAPAEEDEKPELDFVVVEEEKLNVPTAGSEVLNQRLTDDHGKQASANNKSAPPLPNRGETFAHAVAASKDGNHESNPKAVVAAAHEEKERKAGRKGGDE